MDEILPSEGLYRLKGKSNLKVRAHVLIYCDEKLPDFLRRHS